MGTFNHGYVNTGDIYFCKDQGFTAQAIRLVTGGYSRRNDITCPTHAGFIYKHASTGVCFFCEIDGGVVSMNPISERINQPNDCPGIMEIWRPLCWVNIRVGSNSQRATAAGEATASYVNYRTGMQTILPAWIGSGTYDIGWVCSQVLGLGNLFQFDDMYVCSEFVWMILLAAFPYCFPFLSVRYGSSWLWNNTKASNDSRFASAHGAIYLPGSDWKWGSSGILPKIWRVCPDHPSPVQLKEASCAKLYPAVYHQVVSKSLWWTA